MLYLGTSVVEPRNDSLGLVLRTGFSSLRGQMLRTVLHPKQRPSAFMLHVFPFLIRLRVAIFILSLPLLVFMI